MADARALRTFPAIDVTWPMAPGDDDVDRALAVLDDGEPTAVETQPAGIRVFFSTEAHRDRAAALMTEAAPHLCVTTLAVPDENWAERSQASVTPIHVGRITVAPPWFAASPSGGRRPSGAIEIVIDPSMGFGTGHHASTRLCLTLLQRQALEGQDVIDVGTGSGVLAIAAVQLGATAALAVDYDVDALQCATENVARNGVAAQVTTRLMDITREPAAGGHDVLLGNLTGGMLIRHAGRLVSEVSPGGTLIISGFQAHERDDVLAAFAAVGADVVDDLQEEDWVAAALRRVRSTPSAPTTH